MSYWKMEKPANNIDSNYNSGDQNFNRTYEGHEQLRFQSSRNTSEGARGSSSVITDKGRTMVVESGEYVNGEFRGSRHVYDLP